MVKAVEILADNLKRGVEVANVEIEDDHQTKDEFMKTQQSKLAKRPRAPRK